MALAWPLPKVRQRVARTGGDERVRSRHQRQRLVCADHVLVPGARQFFCWRRSPGALLGQGAKAGTARKLVRLGVGRGAPIQVVDYEAAQDLVVSCYVPEKEFLCKSGCRLFSDLEQMKGTSSARRLEALTGRAKRASTHKTGGNR